MTMDSRQIILLAATIAVIFENANAEQLSIGKFNEKETSTDAFKRAYDTLTVPKSRIFTVKRGILYEYLDHLYSAAVAVCKHVFLEEPIKWCILNIQEYRKPKDEDPRSVCIKLMRPAGYIDLSFGYFDYMRDTITPFIEYTNVKRPKDFCDEYKPNVPENPVKIEIVLFDPSKQYQPLPARTKNVVINPCQQYHQPPDYQNENVVFDPNQHYQSLPAQRTKHSVFDLSQQYQPLATQKTENVVFGPSQPSHQLPAQRTENVVFDPSSQHLQPRAQEYEHPNIDLNLRLSITTPSVYPGEHSSSDCNQTEISTSYVDSDESLSFDLNKSPPKD